MPLVLQVGDSNVGEGRRNQIANGWSSLLFENFLHVRKERCVKRQLTELTQIFEPNDSCFDLASFTLPLKHSKLGLLLPTVQ